ncbi:MAG: cytochrome P460 family protein [Deltaproteobacteria bacterium]|nr:MAG: cytochrome P460 family protein [Deltaproteobacteria bacterium]
MHKVSICFVFFLLTYATLVYAAGQTPEPSHGIAYPKGWQNWGTIAVSHRIDNNTLRVVLGNDDAIKAARSGKTNPWPDGAILGKVVWKETKLENWKEAIVPNQLVHAEFMFKDSKKYSQSYGWGWARWIGLEQKPFNVGSQVCISCHKPVKSRDWVFTEPARFPK